MYNQESDTVYTWYQVFTDKKGRKKIKDTTKGKPGKSKRKKWRRKRTKMKRMRMKKKTRKLKVITREVHCISLLTLGGVGGGLT